MREQILIYGASGHAKVIIEIAEALKLKIGGIIDDNREIHEILDYKVEHEISLEEGQMIIAIGNNYTRQIIAQNQHHRSFRSLIHPKSNISTRTIIKQGTVIMAGATINTSVVVGEHCIINTNASVDHDCIIEDYAHIGPNVALAGNVHVEKGTQIGIGACIAPGVKIGKWCVIGAGAVIINDVPDFAVVVGNPGKIISFQNKSLLKNIENDFYSI